MSVEERLYPPLIGSSIPAFYSQSTNEENARTAIIAVPFAMNRAVSASQINGFILKIKTAQTNVQVGFIKVYGASTAIADRIVRFTWTDEEGLDKVKVGQYLKIQLAYATGTSFETLEPGYFSTVATVKYTSKPEVSIEGLESNLNRMRAFRSTYLGVYELTDDKSERPYAYNFSLYDREGLVETSGWLLHNNNVNTTSTEILTLERTTDSYSFKTAIPVDVDHYIQYGVRTINNLEVYSPMYTVVEPGIGGSTFSVNLNAENNYEEGYIELSLELNEGVEIDAEDDSIEVSIEILRSELTDDFSSWRSLKRVYFSSYEDALVWKFRDMTIEQGVTYRYCFRQYDSKGFQSDRSLSNTVMADFEDMFLYDGERQLKIRFNPKVSSFKATQFEQKVDTIGSRYPFIFRNGVVNYKEFPIAGLISYHMDNNEMFMNHQEDLNIILGKDAQREDGTPTSGTEWKTSETLDSIGYNMRAERRFKLRLLEWLGDGKIKLFKSPAEGNYLVRILNVSLTPEDKLGRMLHNFTATAYEVEELSYDNLVNLGFITAVAPEEEQILTGSRMFKDAILAVSSSAFSKSTFIQVNEEAIKNSLKIFPALNSESKTGSIKFYVRIGSTAGNDKTLIEYMPLIIESENIDLPNVYICANDNESLWTNAETTYAEASAAAVQQWLVDLVGDSVLTYNYSTMVQLTGEFNNLNDVYIENKIETAIGPRQGNNFLTFSRGISGNTVNEFIEITKFFVLDFQEKAIIDLVRVGSEYQDSSTNNTISYFDNIYLYRYNNNYYLGSNSSSLGNQLSADEVASLYRVRLQDEDGVDHIFTHLPILNLDNLFFNQIEIGAGIIFNYAYQRKVTIYNENNS